MNRSSEKEKEKNNSAELTALSAHREDMRGKERERERQMKKIGEEREHQERD